MAPRQGPPSLPRSVRSSGNRGFLRSLYGFDYLWEVYVPAAKRRWGYYVLPLLFGDSFVGRIEPRIDRKAGVLRVVGLWWEDGFDPLATDGFIEAFAAALDVHRRFGGVERVRLPKTAQSRAIAAEVRERIG
ncbi:MAG: DNA glycosylase AlkZ-like family protein [Gaiellaceae bacterium]